MLEKNDKYHIKCSSKLKKENIIIIIVTITEKIYAHFLLFNKKVPPYIDNKKGKSTNNITINLPINGMPEGSSISLMPNRIIIIPNAIIHHAAIFIFVGSETFAIDDPNGAGFV